MSYGRFVWYSVRLADGRMDDHRWDATVSPDENRLTLEQYHAQEGMTLVAGPFKTRKEAMTAN